MLSEVLDKIQECKAHIDTLSIRISGEVRVTCWFKELCKILSELLYCITNYIKINKGQYEGDVKDNVLLYLMQMTASLSLLIKVFLKEQEVTDVISEARLCILKQLSWCLDGLTGILKFENGPDTTPGSFIKWMDASLDKLAEIDVEIEAENALSICKEVRTIVEEVLCHAMSIAQVSLPEDCKIIKGASHTVLENLETLTKEVSKDSPNVAMVNLFIDSCTDKLCLLERKVNVAVLKLTLHIFKDYTAPLEKLYEYCFDDKEKNEDTLDSLVADFDLHVDRIMQIGLFAVACSTDADRCIKMRSCLASLEALEGELVPSLSAVSIDPSVHNTHFALLLKSYWVNQAKTLRDLIYLIIDPGAFCQVTYERLKQLTNEICEDLKSNNCNLSENQIREITKNAQILKSMIRTSMTDLSVENLDEIRNKFKDFIDILHELEACIHRIGEDYKINTRIVKRCKILLTTIKALMKALMTPEDPHKTIDASKEEVKVNGEIEKNSLLDKIEDKGKQIVKDRSILYKTPTKMSLLKKLTQDFDQAKSKGLPLSRLVHLRNINFCAQKSITSNDQSIALQITDILNNLTSLSNSILKI